MTIFLDFEAQSEADLKKVGAWAYSEHPSTRVICACWAFDRGPVRSWANPELLDHDGGLGEMFRRIEAGEPVEAHHVAIEYSIWNNICVPKLGWPEIPQNQWRDTMAVACYYSMPAALDNLCKALGLPGKNKDGDRLINRYSKLHNKNTRRDIPEEDMLAWLRYCGDDVDQERAAAYMLGELPEEELEIFLHELEINARGIRLDTAGIGYARELVANLSGEIKEEFRELTGLNPGQIAKFQEWLAEQGVTLPDLQKDTLEELLDKGRIDNEPAPPLPDDARKALTLRRRFARTSTSKLDTGLRQRGRDGRIRFQSRYHGASTGRPTGGGFQPLNMMRSWENVPPEQLVADIKLGSARFLDAQYGDAMEAVGRATRHWIIPDDGSRIVAGDFSSIEAVINACLAGEEWKIELFRNKGDPYATFASKATGREVQPKKVNGELNPLCTQQDLDDRQNIGKPGELAFGYQGAVNAWRNFDSSDRFTDAKIAVFVREWRDLHSRIREQWYGLEDACLEAATWPGRTTGWGMIGFERVDGWLTMILPDGKRLWYWAPQVKMMWPQWHQPSEDEECAAGTCGCNKRPQVTYLTEKNQKFIRVPTYGGKLTENAVQAVNRQIMEAAKLRLRAAGYPLILSVYDEGVAEMPEGRGSPEEMREIMEVPAGDWCTDWPIRVECWEGLRYRSK